MFSPGNLTAALLISAILCAAGTDAAAGQESDFLEIKKLYKKKDAEGVVRKASAFFKKYPDSSRIPDIRFLLAENEDDPDEAIKRYRAVIDKFRNYPDRDLAEYRICTILELQGNWQKLDREAEAALKKFPSSQYAGDFLVFRCMAAVGQHKYEEAGTAFRQSEKKDNSYDRLGRAELLNANAVKNSTGYSRNYIYRLRELLIGYEHHSVYPTVILLLGDFYERTGAPGKALSAYRYIKKEFPRSPEAGMMRKRLAALEGKKITPENLFPDQDVISGSQTIDLGMHQDLYQTDEHDILFSVSVGPFKGKKQAEKVLPVLKKIGPVTTFLKNEGFYHYTGKYRTAREAADIKVRIAEEYGINGTVVRFSKDGSRTFIYGEDK